MAALPDPGPLLGQAGSRSKSYAMSIGTEISSENAGKPRMHDFAFFPVVPANAGSALPWCESRHGCTWNGPMISGSAAADGSTASAISERMDLRLHNPGTEPELI